MDSPQENTERIGGFQIIILVLSVLVLVSMLTDAATDLPAEASKILQTLDNIVCVIFLLDFFIRFYRAPKKAVFMKWGWIDLVASIPNVDFLRWGRAVRVLRIIRILRGIRSIHKVTNLIFRHRVKSGFGALLMTFFLLIIFSSVTILICESGGAGNIKNAEDAVWWSVTTITTVGYGDRYPVTTEGRAIAMVLMIAGVGLFGTISGLIATVFLGKTEDQSQHELAVLTAEIRTLQKQVQLLAIQERPNKVAVQQKPR